MEKKVQKLLARIEELEHALGDPSLLGDQKRYRELTQEHAYISDVRSVWEEIQKKKRELADNKELLELEEDVTQQEAIQKDSLRLEEILEKLKHKLQNLLVPPDPNDHKNSIIELRAGTGGDEAALFVGDCVRMYKLFADQMGWRYEELACTPSEAGGYKEYIMAMSGQNINRYMRYEGGTHRVQRVPDTETQGRVHTSAITCAVLLEPDEETAIKIDEKDLRVDTYRSSGAGGQHVNTTDSAVRITHIPTGIVAYCQEERSQHKNRDKAMRLLKAKIAEEERRKLEQERSDIRTKQVGTGDRSERIRTYNFPQNRVTDHRINLTLYNLDRVMNGDMGGIAEALITHFHQA
jgi:peptide chain release factor 1